jgi:hypothetical protein
VEYVSESFEPFRSLLDLHGQPWIHGLLNSSIHASVNGRNRHPHWSSLAKACAAEMPTSAVSIRGMVDVEFIFFHPTTRRFPRPVQKTEMTLRNSTSAWKYAYLNEWSCIALLQIRPLSQRNTIGMGTVVTRDIKPEPNVEVAMFCGGGNH